LPAPALQAQVLGVLKHHDITDKILQAFFKVVYPELGYGFLEKVYENSS
jgi:hypothetical protein